MINACMFQDTFLLVGGYCSLSCDPSQFLSSVLEFDPSLPEGWILREERLTLGRYGLAATTERITASAEIES